MTLSDPNLAINGGMPVRLQPWPTFEHGTGSVGELAKQDVLRVLESGRLFRYDTRNTGDTTTGQFESALTAYFGTRYALAVSSGTAALALAIMALDLPPGAEVACPVFGFPATASAAILAGAKPRLFAVDADLHLDLQDLNKRWSERLAAIVVVHMRGFPGPMDAILDFANAKGVPVIEDAVPALGARLGERLVGTLGRAGCFSTQSDKTINTGEGGFLVTDDRQLFERAVLLSGAYEGRFRKHLDALSGLSSEFSLPLFSFRMDEMRSALALSQLRELDDRVKTFRRNYDYISSRLAGVFGLRIRKPIAPHAYLGDSLVFFTDQDRAEWVAEALTAEGISARSFGSVRKPNVRAFWHWGFLQEQDAGPPGSYPSYLKTSVTTLRSSVDIALSRNLSLKDLDQAAEAILKVTAALRN